MGCWPRRLGSRRTSAIHPLLSPSQQACLIRMNCSCAVVNPSVQKGLQVTLCWWCWWRWRSLLVRACKRRGPRGSGARRQQLPAPLLARIPLPPARASPATLCRPRSSIRRQDTGPGGQKFSANTASGRHCSTSGSSVYRPHRATPACMTALQCPLSTRTASPVVHNRKAALQAGQRQHGRARPFMPASSPRPATRHTRPPRLCPHRVSFGDRPRMRAQ